LFLPTPQLEAWAKATFVSPNGRLSNPDHLHLISAQIGFLWTSYPASRQMVTIVGQAELASPPPSMGKWARARWEHQIEQWFGAERQLDFIITIYAPFAALADDATFCSLIEHELYHCGQRLDEYDNPKFRKDGTPMLALRGHDVEEFVGIVRRYGAGAAAGQTAELIAAGRRKPEIATAAIGWACGSCRRKAA
jgi:hypothetical protein